MGCHYLHTSKALQAQPSSRSFPFGTLSERLTSPLNSHSTNYRLSVRPPTVYHIHHKFVHLVNKVTYVTLCPQVQQPHPDQVPALHMEELGI